MVIQSFNCQVFGADYVSENLSANPMQERYDIYVYSVTNYKRAAIRLEGVEDENQLNALPIATVLSRSNGVAYFVEQLGNFDITCRITDLTNRQIQIRFNLGMGRTATLFINFISQPSYYTYQSPCFFKQQMPFGGRFRIELFSSDKIDSDLSRFARELFYTAELSTDDDFNLSLRIDQIIANLPFLNNTILREFIDSSGNPNLSFPQFFAIKITALEQSFSFQTGFIYALNAVESNDNLINGSLLFSIDNDSAFAGWIGNVEKCVLRGLGHYTYNTYQNILLANYAIDIWQYEQYGNELAYNVISSEGEDLGGTSLQIGSYPSDLLNIFFYRDLPFLIFQTLVKVPQDRLYLTNLSYFFSFPNLSTVVGWGLYSNFQNNSKKITSQDGMITINSAYCNIYGGLTDIQFLPAVEQEITGGNQIAFQNELQTEILVDNNRFPRDTNHLQNRVFLIHNPFNISSEMELITAPYPHYQINVIRQLCLSKYIIYRDKYYLIKSYSVINSEANSLQAKLIVIPSNNSPFYDRNFYRQ